jgi:hypothetical protein
MSGKNGVQNYNNKINLYPFVLGVLMFVRL